MSDKIIIRGARVHNLKNITVEIPKNKLVVITGLSGSGKSSLAFDTIFAEGQRRYVDSLSSYARQFLGVTEKPDVDSIDGLSPAIAIDQRSVTHNPRSTVGTVTEIYDYLRLLFSKAGTRYCHRCGAEVHKQTLEEITKKIVLLGTGEYQLIAPVVRHEKGSHKKIISGVSKSGYLGLLIDGKFYTADELNNLNIDKAEDHSLDIVVTKLKLNGSEPKIIELVKVALDLGNGEVRVKKINNGGPVEYSFSQYYTCQNCNITLAEIEPRSFSFNSPQGACPDCAGLGIKMEVDIDLVIPNKKLTIAEGAIKPWVRMVGGQTGQYKLLEVMAKANGFSLDMPVEKLTDEQLEMIFVGTGSRRYKVGTQEQEYEGVVAQLAKRYRESDSDFMRSEIEGYMRSMICPACQGQRLKVESLSVKIGGVNIAQAVAMNINEVENYFKGLDKVLNKTERQIASQIIREVLARLNYLRGVGLDYLTLDRTSGSLSGGEAQRIRLATQMGSGLSGVIYILDEPSIGLHQKDADKLIKTLKSLRDMDNTVIVVEHDEMIMREAQEIIDIGPGAGEYGGEIIAQGTLKQILDNKKSLTGQYLSGKKKIETPSEYRSGSGKYIEVVGATAFNLKNITAKIPLGKFVCLTGVSGSGKSTLMLDILSKALTHHFYRAKDLPGEHKEIRGIEHIDKVISIDQSPIGRTPRSNPATYTGVFTYIRDLFTQVQEAKIRGYDAGKFSFNVKGGRCEACAGDGLVKIEMQFLSDVYVACDECHGKRYRKEILEVHYRNKNVSDILEMTVEEARTFFSDKPIIAEKLNTLAEVGLGYIKLGQSATTLSGGEAQRVKLATELARRSTGKTLYILDEPTTGLHFDDIKRLLAVLQRLVDKGNTVLVIEHNLDVIKSSDWVIDLGPDGGDKGGEIVATGTPEDIVKEKRSHTGRYLKEVL
ncbi:excinuclease ABC subunit UvrA [Candidatus Falkowbacteria bacterium]|nr:excinuclease ABC subunit UvrA [Candidatus Falkowbacteria bacterium]